MNLDWLIRRLRAMSFGEMLFRAGMLTQDVIERGALRLNYQPSLSASFEPATQLFAPSTVSTLSGLASKDCRLATCLRNGKLSLFEYGYLEVGNPIEWHCDPLTRVESPRRRFGRSLDYRDEKVVGNAKTVLELGRHQFLIPLAIHYVLERDERS